MSVLSRNRVFPGIAFSVLAASILACSASSAPAEVVPQQYPSDTPPAPETLSPTESPAPPEAPKPSPSPVTSPAEEEESPEEAGEASPGGGLTAEGPWLIFTTLPGGMGAAGMDGLWAVNADGSGLTNLVADQLIAGPYDLGAAISPTGEHVAYITATDSFYRGLRLNLLSLPGGESQVITPLQSEETQVTDDMFPGDETLEAARAIVDLPSVAWSPDGRHLAFLGAQEGPTSDLYVYSLVDGTITRLTDGPSQAIRPVWSPDGQYIVHAGVSTLGTGAGYGMEGVWAARADDSGVLTLYDPTEGGRMSGDEVIVGWADPQTFIVYTWDPMCGGRELRTYNIPTGEITMLWEGYFDRIAVEPEGGTALLTVSTYTAECTPGITPGAYLIPPDGTPQQVTSGAPGLLRWEPAVEGFVIDTPAGPRVVSLDGEVSVPPAPTYPLAVSPDGRWWAWSSGDPGSAERMLWIGTTEPGAELRQVFDEWVFYATWSPDGRSLFFFSDDRLYVAHAPDYGPLLIGEGMTLAGESAIVWVR